MQHAPGRPADLSVPPKTWERSATLDDSLAGASRRLEVSLNFATVCILWGLVLFSALSAAGR